MGHLGGFADVILVLLHWDLVMAYFSYSSNSFLFSVEEGELRALIDSADIPPSLSARSFWIYQHLQILRNELTDREIWQLGLLQKSKSKIP